MQKNKWFCFAALLSGFLVLPLEMERAQAQNAAPGRVFDTEINRAIQEVTGRAPRPEETDPARYGFSYAEIKSRVARVYLPCDDAQVSQAIFEITGRPARGLEGQGECHTGLYGGGRWDNYADLKSKVRQTLVTAPFQSGVCRLSEVTKAITEVKTMRGAANAKPSGAGESGECNSALYGDGAWTSYPDLKLKVASRLNSIQAAGLRLMPDNSVTPIPSRGKSSKWLAVAGSVFSVLGQWKAEKAANQQAAPQQMVPQPAPGMAMPGMPGQGMEMSAPPQMTQSQPMPGQPMPGQPMPQPGMSMAPTNSSPMGGLQPNMLTPELLQQLLQLLQAQQTQQQPPSQPQNAPAPLPE